MKLYLVRHGEAEVTREGDKTLSQKGRDEIRLVAEFLKQSSIHVRQLYHSELLRAKQTAEELVRGLSQRVNINALQGLMPDDPVDTLAMYCNYWEEDTMLVGHLPFLHRLTSHLLFNREDIGFLNFPTGCVVCLERIHLFKWYLHWVVNPLLLLPRS